MNNLTLVLNGLGVLLGAVLVYQSWNPAAIEFGGSVALAVTFVVNFLARLGDRAAAPASAPLEPADRAALRNRYRGTSLVNAVAAAAVICAIVLCLAPEARLLALFGGIMLVVAAGISLWQVIQLAEPRRT